METRKKYFSTSERMLRHFKTKEPIFLGNALREVIDQRLISEIRKLAVQSKKARMYHGCQDHSEL